MPPTTSRFANSFERSSFPQARQPVEGGKRDQLHPLALGGFAGRAVAPERGLRIDGTAFDVTAVESERS